MKRYYIKEDDQFDYPEGEELYHLFDRDSLNDFGEHSCLLSFGTYKQCSAYQQELENGAPPICMDGPSIRAEADDIDWAFGTTQH